VTYYLWTIGCQMNVADSRRVAEELEQLGFQPASRPEDADLILLNTCVVRQSAEDKVIGRLTSLRGLKRYKPGLHLALIGCFVDDVPALRQRYPWVDSFFQPSDVAAVVELARRLAPREPLEPYHTPLARRPLFPSPVPVSTGVPISYGCNHVCTYCIVRLRRGPEVSRPVAGIVAEVQALARRGVREVTLLGQNVDSYGRDLPPLSGPGPRSGPPDLADLLEAVHEVEGLARIRFLTSHPADMTDRLLQTAACLPKVCEHLEIPVQSGDDTLLRRMGRGYTVAGYRNLLARARRAFAHQAAAPLGLATDVIVGFPGESDAQFEATYRLLEEQRFDMVHVAAYSPRPGTPASRLADDVPAGEKERRRRAVDALQERIVAEINAGLLGQTVEVLVEGRQRGKWRGRTRSNKLVFFDLGRADRTGELVPVRITQTGPWSLQGEVESCETTDR
jgi:tRNA-2-methylthio-N6-dimethylallyladenosine synthase